MTKTIKYQPSYVNTGDFSKEALEALKKQFNLENYQEHYINLKMHLSNCCDYQVKENTDICGKCSEHCETTLK